MPLNYFEIYGEKASGKWDDLQIHFVNPTEAESNASRDYKDFLKNYFGHIAVTSEKNAPTISLLLESKTMPLTFQASQVNNVVFTSDSKVLYPEMNRVSVLLAYRDEPPSFQKLAEKLKIKSDEDFKEKMGVFAAEPKYRVFLRSNVPWFEHYEYRLSESGEWERVNTDGFDWDATKPLNQLEVRAVNQMGRTGPSTQIEISYQ